MADEEEPKKPRLNICHNCTNGRIQVWRRAIIEGEEPSLQEGVDCPVCDGSARIVNGDDDQHPEHDDREARGVGTWCRNCNGQGMGVIPRMAVLSGGRSLGDAMRGGEFVTGFEARPCATCDGTGWIPGMNP